MKMRLKNGKRKVLTLSYDDGVVQDIRLIEIMNKYGLKGNFNVNSGMYLSEDTVRENFYGRLKLSEAIKLYKNSGHEVAVHGLTPPFLEKLATDEIIYEITEDRKNLESQYAVIVRGMAYPYGTYNDKVKGILNKCQISYSRTVKSTHNYENLEELTKKFVETHNKW